MELMKKFSSCSPATIALNLFMAVDLVAEGEISMSAKNNAWSNFKEKGRS